MDPMPALRSQQAVVVGEGVVRPRRSRIDGQPEDKRPLSDTASFAGKWQQEGVPGGFRPRPGTLAQAGLLRAVSPFSCAAKGI